MLGNVWHGTQEPWHNWDKLAGRFVSEFGMEAYPDIRTVDYWLGGNVAERFPQSRTNNNHNKADGFERRLEVFILPFKPTLSGADKTVCGTSCTLWRTLSIPSRWIGGSNLTTGSHEASLGPECGRSYVYYTQIMQAETLGAAYRLWRRNWAGKGREYTAGALVWQVSSLHLFCQSFQLLTID